MKIRRGYLWSVIALALTVSGWVGCSPEKETDEPASSAEQSQTTQLPDDNYHEPVEVVLTTDTPELAAERVAVFQMDHRDRVVTGRGKVLVDTALAVPEGVRVKIDSGDWYVTSMTRLPQGYYAYYGLLIEGQAHVGTHRVPATAPVPPAATDEVAERIANRIMQDVDKQLDQIHADIARKTEQQLIDQTPPLLQMLFVLDDATHFSDGVRRTVKEELETKPQLH